jgi:hypothetical protein
VSERKRLLATIAGKPTLSGSDSRVQCGEAARVTPASTICRALKARYGGFPKFRQSQQPQVTGQIQLFVKCGRFARNKSALAADTLTAVVF